MKKLKEPSVVIGSVFGGLTVIENAEPRKKNRYWKCRCVCGNIVEKYHGHLASGSTVSCGCRKTYTSEVWHDMIKKLEPTPPPKLKTAESRRSRSKEEIHDLRDIPGEGIIIENVAPGETPADTSRYVYKQAPEWLQWTKEMLSLPDHLTYSDLRTYRPPHFAVIDDMAARAGCMSLTHYALSLILTAEGPVTRDEWLQKLTAWIKTIKNRLEARQ